MNVGIDLMEIDRIEKSIRKPRFLSKIFSPSELKYFSQKQFKPEVIAGNFCAKEAFSKAMGTGFRGFSFNEISVLRDYMGTPYISVTGGAKRVLESKNCSVTVSISHTRQYATAVVIAYPKDK